MLLPIGYGGSSGGYKFKGSMYIGEATPAAQGKAKNVLSASH